MRRVAPQQRLVLELEVLGQRHDDLLRARPGDLVVAVGHVLLDGDRREASPDRPGAARRSSDLGGVRRRRGRAPASPAATIPTPRTSTATTISPTRGDAADDAAPASPPARAARANRRRSSAADCGSGSSRSSSGRAAQTDDEARRAAPTFVPNSLVCGAISSVLATATRRPNTTRPTRPAGHGLRVGDHEEQEDQDLGRGDDDPPEVDAADRRERPVRGHAVARRGEHARRRPRA